MRKVTRGWRGGGRVAGASAAVQATSVRSRRVEVVPRGVHKYDVHEQKEKAKRSSKEKCHIVTLTHIQKQGRFAAKKPQNRTNDSEENRTDSYVIYTDSFVSCEVLLICEESPLRSAPPWLIIT